MISIQTAKEEDFVQIEEILKENEMFVADIDGKEMMKRIQKISGKYFLVAKEDHVVIGFIRVVYDGSRALIHQMAVRKTNQRKGVGKKLILEVCKMLKDDGAPTVSVTVTDKSTSYYQSLSFKKLPITLMLAEDINEVITLTS
ncbi:MAG TPA: GNAT family N-acetyltransferase [archaeon]|nr:GNAT family N-acetyltransferase [archaeon]